MAILPSPSTPTPRLEEILHSINQALKKAKRESAKWKPTSADDMDSADDNDDDLKPKFKRLKLRIRQIVMKRCRQVSAGVDGVKWALYKKEQCEALTTKLLELIEQLEKAVESESTLDELSHNESKAIGESLKTFLEVVGKCDPRLEESARRRLEDKEELSNISMSATNNYGLQMGVNRGEMKGLSFGTGNTTTNNWH